MCVKTLNQRDADKYELSATEPDKEVSMTATFKIKKLLKKKKWRNFVIELFCASSMVRIYISPVRVAVIFY